MKNLQTKLNSKANSDHTHDDVYTKGVGVDSNGIVKFSRDGKWYNYTMGSSMGNAVSLKDHRHDISDINDLRRQLDLFTSGLQDTMGRLIKKADENHTHEIAEVNGLQKELKTKASSKHYHDIEDINNLKTALNGKASLNHTHSEYLKKGDPIILTSQQKAELKGDRGATGANGTSVSISSTLKNTTKRVTVVTFSNGTVIEIPWGENGKNGAQGWRGDPGKDGSSITTWVGTQSQYNSISSKSSTTLYLIKE